MAEVEAAEEERGWGWGGLVVEGRNSQGQLKLAEHGLLLIRPSPSLVMLPRRKLYDGVARISRTQRDQIPSSSPPPTDRYLKSHSIIKALLRQGRNNKSLHGPEKKPRLVICTLASADFVRVHPN